uniref:Uncharacterized protein n=1 Tax=Anguilla anguilla TaxID=7936 RepID=A0A0E9VEV1_ANGAN
MLYHSLLILFRFKQKVWKINIILANAACPCNDR